MANLKLLVLMANLVFVRFATAEHQQLHNQTSDPEATSKLTSQQKQFEIFDNINSLDYSPDHQIRVEPVVSTMSQSTSNTVVSQPDKSSKRTGKSRAGNRKRVAPSSTAAVAHLLMNLVGQLEKVDVKRLILDSFATRNSHNGNEFQQRNHTSTNTKGKERVNVSALSAETGNLLSITKQLVKLARNQYGGGEFIDPSTGPPLFMPSMLSAAASHIFHDSTGDFTGAALKSDWFWMVVPAVIVIGSSVIVIPLIAAWIVSNMMSQNSFTVSAGRRRRKRDIEYSGDDTLHKDMFKLLDVHQLLKDSVPQLLIGKLSRLDEALKRVDLFA